MLLEDCNQTHLWKQIEHIVKANPFIQEEPCNYSQVYSYKSTKNPHHVQLENINIVNININVNFIMEENITEPLPEVFMNKLIERITYEIADKVVNDEKRKEKMISVINKDFEKDEIDIKIEEYIKNLKNKTWEEIKVLYPNFNEILGHIEEDLIYLHKNGDYRSLWSFLEASNSSNLFANSDEIEYE